MHLGLLSLTSNIFYGNNYFKLYFNSIPKKWLVPKQNVDSYKRFKIYILHHSHLVLDFLNFGVLLGRIVYDVASLVGGVNIGDS
jgi:hypothetical protein